MSPREFEAIVLEEAGRHERALRDTIARALSELDQVVTDRILRRGIAAGDPAAAVAEILEAWQDRMVAAMTAGIMGAVGGAGALAAARMPQLTRVNFVFGGLAQPLVDYARTQSLDLVRQVTDGQRATMRATLLAGQVAGHNPVTVARGVREGLGLTVRQAAAVANFRRELERWHERRAADGWGLGNEVNRVNGRQVSVRERGLDTDGIHARRLRDFRYDGVLARTLGKGVPLKPEQVDRMVAAYRRKALRLRSETIARTEALRATNAGVMEAWRQAIMAGRVDEALVRRQWIISKDERTCPVCRPIPRMNPSRGVMFAAPFATPAGWRMLPPAHPNCRCTVFVRAWEPGQLVTEARGRSR